MIFNMACGGGKPRITYTGAYTTQSYTADGKPYTLYTLTGSGTLTVRGRARHAGVWLCGGGANGRTGGSEGNRPADFGKGGAGAYCAQLNDVKLKGDYVVTIGAAQGATSFGSLLSVSAVSGISGGSGGGASSYYAAVYPQTGAPGTGDGQSKYPFGDTTHFDPHCAGGGGGGMYYRGSGNTFGSTEQGGAGGTNGGSGGGTVSGGGNGNELGSMAGGSGGNKGGGKGGAASDSSLYGQSYTYNGASATFYGSGGGGGGSHVNAYVEASPGYGGAGYQGVVYLRVPE